MVNLVDIEATCNVDIPPAMTSDTLCLILMELREWTKVNKWINNVGL